MKTSDFWKAMAVAVGIALVVFSAVKVVEAVPYIWLGDDEYLYLGDGDGSDPTSADFELHFDAANTRLELWDAQQWRQVLLDVESNAEMIAEQFDNITF